MTQSQNEIQLTRQLITRSVKRNSKESPHTRVVVRVLQLIINQVLSSRIELSNGLILSIYTAAKWKWSVGKMNCQLTAKTTSDLDRVGKRTRVSKLNQK